MPRRVRRPPAPTIDLFAGETGPPPTFHRLPLTQLHWVVSPVAESFVQNITRMGVLEPVLVVPSGRPHHYNVIAGRRRCSAAACGGLTEVPAMVYPRQLSGGYDAAIALVENNQRQPNPITDHRAALRLVQAGYTEAQIAASLGLSRAMVRARLALQLLIPPLQRRLEQEQFSAGIARRLSRFTRDQQYLAEDWLASPGRARTDSLTRYLNGVTAGTVHDLLDPIFNRIQIRYGAEPDWTPPAPATPRPTSHLVAEIAAVVDDLPTVGWRRTLVYLEFVSGALPIAADDDAEQARELVDALFEIVARQAQAEVTHA